MQSGKQNSRNGRSESHESHAAVSTVTAGDNLLLVAGRDIASQAAGMAAENNVVIRGGRDVNGGRVCRRRRQLYVEEKERD